MVKEEFKDIELHDGGGLNFMVTRDNQKSRKIDIYGYRGMFFLTFGFKDGMCDWVQKEALLRCQSVGRASTLQRRDAL